SICVYGSSAISASRFTSMRSNWRGVSRGNRESRANALRTLSKILAISRLVSPRSGTATISTVSIFWRRLSPGRLLIGDPQFPHGFASWQIWRAESFCPSTFAGLHGRHAPLYPGKVSSTLHVQCLLPHHQRPKDPRRRGRSRAACGGFLLPAERWSLSVLRLGKVCAARSDLERRLLPSLFAVRGPGDCSWNDCRRV